MTPAPFATFTVTGKPKGKARPRVTRTGHAYTPKPTKVYESSIAWQAKAAMQGRAPSTLPVIVEIRCTFTAPRKWPLQARKAVLATPLPATCKPDADNVAKAVLDACNGVVYIDDAQAADLRVTKWYGGAEEVNVTIWEIDNGA